MEKSCNATSSSFICNLKKKIIKTGGDTVPAGSFIGFWKPNRRKFSWYFLNFLNSQIGSFSVLWSQLIRIYGPCISTFGDVMRKVFSYWRAGLKCILLWYSHYRVFVDSKLSEILHPVTILLNFYIVCGKVPLFF